MQSLSNENSDVLLKKTSPKAGLVIQGPLYSYGRTAKSASITFDKVSHDDCVNFHCEENIIRYAHECDIPTVYVSWIDDDTSHLELKTAHLDHFHILKINDDTPKIKPRGEVITGNNKYRQIYSTYRGLLYLMEMDCSIAMKVRSDQWIDIDGLLHDTLRVMNSGRAKLLVPYLNPEQPSTLPDFYFGGKTGDLEKIFKYYLTNIELFDHVHHDYFFKFCRPFMLPPGFDYKLYTTNLFLDYIGAVWSAVYCPASREVYRNLEWRGEKFDELTAKDKNLYLDDICEINNISNEFRNSFKCLVKIG